MANLDSRGSQDLDESEVVDQSSVSTLLGVPNCMFRVNNLQATPEFILNCQAHKPMIPYHGNCDEYLKKLGLFQLAQISHVKTDLRLITALVEHWRPETHTFHLPVEEVGVTLQDVSCLWGLPICGPPVIGPSDHNCVKMVEECFGSDISAEMMKKKRRRKSPNDMPHLQQSGYRISLKSLREKYKEMPSIASAEYVRRYTLAFVLDLFGSMVFPDTTGDSVPAFYLIFLRNLDNPPVYNWGAAMLADLYRNLSISCRAGKKSMGGAVLFLQHWSWGHFAVARPRRVGPVVQLGGDVPDDRPPFAKKWKYYQTYELSPAHSSMEYYRNEFESLLDVHVNWCPYDDVLHLLPSRVHADRQYWLARVPLLHMWIVSWHYPDRVMRQFGLFQPIPPQAPHSWTELQRLNKIIHTSKSNRDWSVKHKTYVQMWHRPEIIVETRPYDDSQRQQYRRWFQEFGMYTVYIRGQIVKGLDRALPPPRDSVEELGFVPVGHRIRRLGQRGLNRVAYMIKELYKKGTKKICKTLLRSHRLDAEDADQVHEFKRVLIAAGLPTNVEEIDDDDGTEEQPEVQFTSQASYNDNGAGTSMPCPHYFPSQEPLTSYEDLGIGQTQPSGLDFVASLYASQEHNYSFTDMIRGTSSVEVPDLYFNTGGGEGFTATLTTSGLVPVESITEVQEEPLSVPDLQEEVQHEIPQVYEEPSPVQVQQVQDESYAFQNSLVPYGSSEDEIEQVPGNNAKTPMGKGYRKKFRKKQFTPTDHPK